ncbi:hypothetical protein ACLB2K_051787 [Fragaria x ananassa]
MRLNSLDDILVAMYLLRSSPAIQVLEIEVRQEKKSNAEEQATNWLYNNRLWEFTQLRRLKVTGFSGVTGEVDFLNHLFSCFPALQELEISFRDNTNMGKGLDAAAGGDYSNRNWSLNQLRIMKVTNVRSEASFIRFLLSSSPMLNTMTLQPVSAGISWEPLELLVKEFKCYSKAELKLLKPLSSESYNNDDFNTDDFRCMCTGFPVGANW